MSSVETKALIRKINGQYTLVASRNIHKGEIVFVMEGAITHRPSQFSVQIAIAKHIEPGEDPADAPRFLVRCLNHSCNPTTYINCDDVTVRAARDLVPGDEINFNYNTTEYDLSVPFRCRCGGGNCFGEIRGFKYLSAEERMTLNGIVASHLIAIEADREPIDGRAAGRFKVESAS